MTHMTQAEFDGMVEGASAEVRRAAKKQARRKEGSTLEREFAFQCRAHNLPPFERELRFAKAYGRQWRFDFAWPGAKVAVEVDGLAVRIVNGKAMPTGRHSTIGGMEDDNEKLNAAQMMGWRVLRFTPSQVKRGYAILCVTRAIWGGEPVL